MSKSLTTVPVCLSIPPTWGSYMPCVLECLDKRFPCLWGWPVRCPSVRSGRWRWSHLSCHLFLLASMWWTLSVLCGIISRGPSIRSQDPWVLGGKTQGIHFLAQMAAKMVRFWRPAEGGGFQILVVSVKF